MPKYSLEKLQALAKSKGMMIDVVQLTPHPVIYLANLKHPVKWGDEATGHRAIPNPKTGMPNFHTLAAVHKFLNG